MKHRTLRKMSDDESLQTDVRSELSFLNKQAKLRKFYAEIKSVTDSVNSFSKEPEFQENEQENDPRAEIQKLEEEIEMMLDEIEEINKILSKKTLMKNPKIKSIKSQVQHLKNVMMSLLERTQNIQL